MTDCNFYTVQSGDTLSEIGQWFGVRWQELARINGIQNPDLIHPGDVLRLNSPQNHNVCNAYRVRSGDTLSEIGARFGVSWQKLAHYNAIPDPNRIFPDQIICVPAVTRASTAQAEASGP